MLQFLALALAIAFSLSSEPSRNVFGDQQTPATQTKATMAPGDQQTPAAADPPENTGGGNAADPPENTGGGN